VFVYIEKDCPSFYGASLEVGYARGLGKVILIVDEKSESDSTFARQFRMVKSTADVVVESFELGISLLERFLV
jgi:hypothetical protein